MRTRIIAVVLVLINLPMIVAAAEAISFYVTERNNGSIVSAGRSRDYLLYVPTSYDRARPAPLVISMHAAALWPAAQRETSRWNGLADREGFIVVYPSADSGHGPRIWPMEGERGTADVRFISDLIDRVSADYNIDASRIFANGLSNGGGMSFVLSCVLSDRIAAVGMVAAAQLLPFSWCGDRRPVPMMAFHGTADPVIPYNGGTSWIARNAFPNVPAWAASWAVRNRCAQAPVDTAVAADVMRRSYGGCANGADVVLYTIAGGGHTWPGGRPLPEWFAGPTSTAIDATREMWSFFRAHPLRR
jgi:polyhydroxybutyrate depolymerase